jgi:hypothetical protein
MQQPIKTKISTKTQKNPKILNVCILAEQESSVSEITTQAKYHPWLPPVNKFYAVISLPF